MSTRKLFKTSSLAVAFAILIVQSFVSCSSDEGGTTDPQPSTFTGVFLDCEVVGLTYQSGSSTPGVTDENGTFTYTPGQPLSFSVGGVQLGTLDDGAAICTPNDFVIPENIARFLQSIDADGIPSNGIDVSTAASALANTNVPSSVFENPNSTDFAADTAIIGALATTGDALLDTATTNTNLRNGTDSTFDAVELAGFAFAVSSPLDAGLGIVKFDVLVNSGDQGSTGSNTPFDETIAQGGSGIGDDFSWNIDAAGVLTLSFTDGSTASVKKSGSSSRAITGIVSEPGSAPSIITLLKPLSVTETNICGAPVTQNGVSTKSFTISYAGGTEVLTFKSDGTMTGVGSIDGPWSGFWSVNVIAPDVIQVIDAITPEAVPADWTFVILLDGSFANGGSLFVADVTFNGLGSGVNDINLTWDEFLFVSITPVIP